MGSHESVYFEVEEPEPHSSTFHSSEAGPWLPRAEKKRKKSEIPDTSIGSARDPIPPHLSPPRYLLDILVDIDNGPDIAWQWGDSAKPAGWERQAPTFFSQQTGPGLPVSEVHGSAQAYDRSLLEKLDDRRRPGNEDRGLESKEGLSQASNNSARSGTRGPAEQGPEKGPAAFRRHRASSLDVFDRGALRSNPRAVMQKEGSDECVGLGEKQRELEMLETKWTAVLEGKAPPRGGNEVEASMVSDVFLSRLITVHSLRHTN